LEELRAVLFDMDGVLLESNEAWFRVMNAAARHFRKPDIERERFAASFGQGIEADVRDFFPGCTVAEVERFYEDHLLDFGEHVRADPEARATLMALRGPSALGEAGGPRRDSVLRAVITNTPTFLARNMLAWTGLIGFIDATVGPGDGVRSKPDPDMVLRACVQLDVDPRAALVVGDSVFDATAAQAAGVQFLGLRMAVKPSVQSLSDVARWVERTRS
jgi:phosphoglycolate phosphatase